MTSGEIILAKSHYLLIYNSRTLYITLQSIIYVGIISAIVISMTTTGFGMSVATAQTTSDNATTTGNMTGGGNMTMGAGNMTMGAGNISGVGGPV